MFTNISAAFVLVALFQTLSFSQVKLLKDLNPGGHSDNAAPTSFQSINGVLYFLATDSENGRQLWKSDGTNEGTTLIKVMPYHGHPGNLVTMNNKLYFYGPGQAAGALWVSDGTNEGTQIVKNDFELIDQLAVVDTKLFFSAYNKGRWSLWTSDGTEAGTKNVKSIGNVNQDSLRHFMGVNRTLYFTANDGSHGTELWKSDGTANGTVMIGDFAAGSAGSLVSGFFAGKDQLYFILRDAAHGAELWRSDGTVAGTYLVMDLNPGGASGNISSLFNFKDHLFFSGTDGANGTKLWRTDGIKNSVTVIASAGTRTYDQPADLNVSRDTLFFLANSGSRRMWKMDLKNSSAKIVTDTNSDLPDIVDLTVFKDSLYYLDQSSLRKNAGYNNYGDPQLLLTSGNLIVSQLVPTPTKLFFIATTFEQGGELWALDKGHGIVVKDINTGAYSGDPSGYVADGAKVYFTAAVGDYNRYVWVTDGTPDGTKRIQNGTGDYFDNHYVDDLFAYNDKVVFASNNQVWCSDGSPAGTLPMPGSAGGYGYANYKGDVYYFSYQGGSTTLSKTNCSAAGAVNIATLSNIGFPLGIRIMKDKLYFTDGHKLWVSDGTAAGTNAFYTFSNGAPSEMIATEGKLFFVVRNNDNYFLGSSDGTAGGTMVFPAAVIGGLTSFTGSCYFASGPDFYKSDGTAAGTTLVKKGAYPWGVYAGNGVTLRKNLIFQGSDAVHGTEVWKTDGSAANTVLLKNILPDVTAVNNFAYNNSEAIQFSLADSVAMFLAQDGANNHQVWTTDGSTAGTYKITNEADLTIKNYFFNKGIVYLNGSSPDSGKELYAFKYVVTGVMDEKLSHVDAFPNPSSRYVTIAANDDLTNASVLVVSVTGVQPDIPQFVHERSRVLDFGEVPNGIYLIRVRHGNGVATKRILIVH